MFVRNSSKNVAYFCYVGYAAYAGCKMKNTVERFIEIALLPKLSSNHSEFEVSMNKLKLVFASSRRLIQFGMLLKVSTVFTRKLHNFVLVPRHCDYIPYNINKILSPH